MIFSSCERGVGSAWRSAILVLVLSSANALGPKPGPSPLPSLLPTVPFQRRPVATPTVLDTLPNTDQPRPAPTAFPSMPTLHPSVPRQRRPTLSPTVPIQRRPTNGPTLGATSGAPVPSPTASPTMVTSVASAALLYVSSSLSIAGTSLVFLDHWRNPKVWARPARRLLTWLCVADFVTALAYLFPASDSSHACTAQATVGIYAPVASFMWTDCIALYVYWIVSSLKRRTWLLRSSRQVFWVFHAVCWTVPGIACLAVLLSGHAGKNENTETSGWCWIKTTADDDVADDDKAERRRRDEMFLWEVRSVLCALGLAACFSTATVSAMPTSLPHSLTHSLTHSLLLAPPASAVLFMCMAR